MFLNSIKLVQLSCILVLAMGSPCQVNTNLTSIYPVNNQQFSLDLSGLFTSDIETYSVQGQARAFSVQQAGVISPQVYSIFGTMTQAVLDVTGETIDNNPNVPTGNYVFLVRNSKNGYQLTAGQTQADGSFLGQNDSLPFSSPNTSCYTTNFPFAGGVVVSCINQDAQGVQFPVFFYNNFASTKQEQPIFTQINTVPNITQPIKRVKSQARTNPLDNGTVILIVGYFYESPGNQSYNADLYFYNLTQKTSSFGGLDDLQSLNITYDKTLTYQNIIDFYLSTDFKLFVLIEDQGLTINNLQISQSQTHPLLSNNQFSALAVYEIQNYPVSGSYYISIGAGEALLYYIYNPIPMELSFISNTVTLSTVGQLPQVYREVQNSFLNPSIAVVALNQLNILAASGPKSSHSTILWVGGFEQTVYTFDIQNSVIVLASTEGVRTVQVGSPLLVGLFKIDQIAPSMIENSLKNGSIEVTARGFNNFTCTLFLNYNVLQTNFIPGAYSTTNDSTTQQQFDFIYVSGQVSTLSLPITFYGPNIGYKSYSNNNPNSTKQASSSTTQWIPITQYMANRGVYPNPLQYPNNIVFAQNYKTSASNDMFLQIVQNSQDYTASFQTCDANACYIQNFLHNQQQIRSADIMYVGSNQQYLAAITVYKANTIIQILRIQRQQSDWHPFNIYQIMITDFVHAPTPQVTSFKFLSGDLYVVTSQPASVQVLRFTSNNIVIKVTELQGPNVSPQNLYVNQEAYGNVVFIDNTINLLVCKVVGSSFIILQTIPYTQLIPQQSVGVGLTNKGIYLAYTDIQQINQLVEFIPRSALNIVSSSGTTQRITLPLLQNKLTYPIVSTFTDSYFYVQAQTTEINIFTLLTYQFASSSFNQLYVSLTYTNQATFLSAVNLNDNDAVILGNGTVLNNMVLPYFQLNFLPSPMINQLIEPYNTVISVCSSQGQAVYNQSIVLSFLNSQLSIQYDVNNNSQIIIDGYLTSSGGNTYINIPFYPQKYFTGQIIGFGAYLPVQNQFYGYGYVQTQMVQQLKSQIFAAQSISTNSEGQTIFQTQFGVYLYNNGDPKLYGQGYSEIFCPLLFTDSSTNKIVSVCNSYMSVQALVQGPEITDPILSINLNLTQFTKGYYLNGFVILSNDTLISIYAVDYSSEPFWYLILNQPNQSPNIVSPVQINVGENIESLQNPVIGFSYSFNESLYIRTIILNVPFGGPHGIMSYLDSISVNSSVAFNFQWLQQVPGNMLLAGTEFVQFLQLDVSKSTSSSITQVPVIITTSQMNYRFNLIYSNNNLSESQFLCTYENYAGQVTLSGASALNGILVIPYSTQPYQLEPLGVMPYQPALVLTLGVYKSSNPLFGGNGTEVCVSETSTQEIIPIIGGAVAGQFQDYTVIPIQTFVLLNGLISFVGLKMNSDFQTSVWQLNPYVTIQMFSQDIQTSVSQAFINIQAINYFGSTEFLNLTINVINEDKHNHSSTFWLIIGLVIGGIIILLGIGAFCYYKRTQKAPDGNEHLIEV